MTHADALRVAAKDLSDDRSLGCPPGMGLGIGWRPELAHFIDRQRDLGFVEIVAESMVSGEPLPEPLELLRERGLAVIPHGISLSLAGADRPDRARIARLADLACQLRAPMVSEHIAFVRAGGLEAGRLLPPPRTRAALDILVENIRLVQAELPAPLALENIAASFEWPDDEMTDAQFLSEVLERTDALLLLDVENLYANSRNHGGDPAEFLGQLPLERLAYVHVGGGIEIDGAFHDTHAHPVLVPVFELLEALAARAIIPGYMLERDDQFPTADLLRSELDAIAAAVERGSQRRQARYET